ncbi:hypothetical protein LVW35_19065 [Pseudomonas sp. HN11]|uniref:hypothetical protein n=1 Tax=Pseudomonas sp. HN11 TaxID=1344094 RepID=UPI001F4707C6|nr:hypothetical protein [Pseudomonas sp. HN11]UII69764.1 hypothetical protein LVW35_19065 [Pseudomonas sp. HN11]
MLSTSRNYLERPIFDAYPAPDRSARVLPEVPIRDATPPTVCPHRMPTSVSQHADAAVLMGTLIDLFKQLLNQIQSLVRKDVRPSDSVNHEKTLPQPFVQPDTVQVDKQLDHISVLSNKPKGEKPKSIWRGFRQGKNGNCVTISAIKAAMAKFGQNPKSIYASVEKTAEGYKVVMRDGFKLNLTDSELNRAIRGSNFVGIDDQGMLKDAHFMFACSAKRAQIENNDGTAKRSFEAAIRSLNDGEDERGPGEGFKRLGLKAHTRRVKVSDFADKSLIGMVNRRGHSVAVVDGCEELYGRKGRRPTNGDAIALV